MPANILFSLLSLALAYLMASWPTAAMLTLIAWGAVIITAALYMKRLQLLLLYGVNLSLLYWIGGSDTFIYLFSFLLAILLMSYLTWRGCSYYEIQKAGISVVILAMSIFMGLVYYQNGNLGQDKLKTEYKQYIEPSIQFYEKKGLLKIDEENGLSRQELEKSMAAYIDFISRLLPAIFYLQAIMVIFFTLFLASFINRGRNDGRLKKKTYAEEIMPWQLVWVAICGLALLLWGKDRSAPIFYGGTNILAVMMPVACYFGLAAVLFRLQRTRKEYRPWVTAALVVLSIFFLPSALVFFSIVGLFDALLDFRKTRIGKGGIVQ